jgi:hypothetical protein
MAIVVVAVLLALVVLGGLACVVSAESQTEEGGSLEPNASILDAAGIRGRSAEGGGVGTDTGGFTHTWDEIRAACSSAGLTTAQTTALLGGLTYFSSDADARFADWQIQEAASRITSSASSLTDAELAAVLSYL